MQYSLIVLELEDVVPRRDLSKPNLFVSITTMPIADRFDLLANGRGPDWLTGKTRLLRQDLSCSDFTLDHDCAKRFKTESVAALRCEGYTVNRNTDLWTVYVIELDPTVIRDAGNGYVYVGETMKTPEQRFAEHKNWSRNGKTRLYSPVVANHGKCLRMDLAPEVSYFDKLSSKRAETEWAQHLRSLGYIVKGGH